MEENEIMNVDHMECYAMDTSNSKSLKLEQIKLKAVIAHSELVPHSLTERNCLVFTHC